MKTQIPWLRRLLPLLLSAVVACWMASCGTATQSGTESSPSVRPPSLPPEAENPTLTIKASTVAKINGTFILSGTVVDLSSQSVSNVEVIAVAVRNNDANNPVTSGSDTTDTNGAFSITLTGLIKNDVVWVGASKAKAQTFTFPLEGNVSTLSGKAYTTGDNEPDMQDGSQANATFRRPQALAVDSTGTYLYVADQENHAIRRVTVADGTVMTFAGAGASIAKDNKKGDCEGTGTSARLNAPEGIVIDSTDTTLYVADSGNHKIRKIVIATQVLTTLVGPANPSESACGLAGMSDAVDGTGSAVRFYEPKGLAISSDGRFLYVADTSNHTLRKIILATLEVSTLAGKAGESEFIQGAGTEARFTKPARLAISKDDKTLYIADSFNYALRKMNLSTGEVSPLLGGKGSFPCQDDGQGENLGLILPAGIQVDPSDTKLYIADSGANKIRVVHIASKNYRLVAGPLDVCTAEGSTGWVDDTLDKARFHTPSDIVLSADGLTLFVTDANNNVIRKIQ